MDYLIPGLLGFLTGGVIFGAIYRTGLVQWLLTAGRPQMAYAKLPDILGVDPLLLTFVFALAILQVLYLMARTRWRRPDELESTVLQERIEAGIADEDEVLAAEALTRSQAQGAGD